MGREEAPDGGNRHGYCTIEMRTRFVTSDVFDLSLTFLMLHREINLLI